VLYRSAFLIAFFCFFENSFSFTFALIVKLDPLMLVSLDFLYVGSLELVSSLHGFLPCYDVLQISKLLKSY
jgi:hypothetical protein